MLFIWRQTAHGILRPLVPQKVKSFHAQSHKKVKGENGDYELPVKNKIARRCKKGLRKKRIWRNLCSEILQKNWLKPDCPTAGHLSPNLGRWNLVMCTYRTSYSVKDSGMPGGMWDTDILINCFTGRRDYFIHCAKKAALLGFPLKRRKGMMILILATAVHSFLRHTVR